ncbi:DRPLA-like protein [Fusarium beomiforme]|uniref:DRPLA-like protein n=1 Tax=Fusarium beomiforme TaxID=44412 RepID=A0A9P5A8L9_9HYPO|nr:DRPLA-like protein [Fusarium beomiforme]
MDFAPLLKASRSYVSSVSPPHQIRPVPALTYQQFPLKASPAPPVASTQMSGRRGMPPHAADQPPVKKHGKWSSEENALIIKLRQCNMKWDDISKRLPGRSATACRQHYQAHLQGQSDWDEELKNKLARLYERFKPEMWAKIAEEMAVPWRAAEAMHWQLGEADMTRRAGINTFSLAAVNVDKSYSFLSSPSPREVHSQPSLPLKEKFPQHLSRYHSPMYWCKHCLHKFQSYLGKDALSNEMAAHKESCPKEPSATNKRDRQQHYIIDEGLWKAFQDGEWKCIGVPETFDENGHREPISISRRSWKQISELIFPSRPTNTPLLAPCQKSNFPPPPLPAVPDPAEVQYPRGNEKQRNFLHQNSLICHSRPSADFPDTLEYVPGLGLAPMQHQSPPRSVGMLPGVTELISGISPFTKSAAVPNIDPITGAGQDSTYSSFQHYSFPSAGSKRRAFSDQYQHEANKRRRITYLTPP